MNEDLCRIPAETIAEMEAKAEASDEDFFIAFGKLLKEWFEQNPI
jgi:hypothetical protein